MSSTNRGAIRSPRDFYATPHYTVASLLSVLDTERLSKMTFGEPCRGTGAIADKISAAHLSLTKSALRTTITPKSARGSTISSPRWRLT